MLNGGLGRDKEVIVSISSRQALIASGRRIASSVLKRYEIVQLLLRLVLILMRQIQ